MNFRLSVLSIFIVLIAPDAIGQSNITNLTINDGLIQNNVTSLLFDDDHYLWIGTNSGLCIYDGRSFFNIHHSHLYPRIITLFNDKEKGLHFTDEFNNVFKKQSQNKNKLNRALSTNTFKIEQLQKCGIYTGELIDHNEVLLRPYKKNLPEIAYQITNAKFIKNNDSGSTHSKFLKGKLFSNFVDNNVMIQSGSDVFCLFSNSIYKIFVLNDSLISIKHLHNVKLGKDKSKLIDKAIFDPITGNFIFGSFLDGLYIYKHLYFSVQKKDIITVPLKGFKYSIYYSHAQLKNGDFIANNSNRSLVWVDEANHLYLADANKIVIKKGSESQVIKLDFGLYGTVSMVKLNDNTKLFSDFKHIIKVQDNKTVTMVAKSNTEQKERFNYLFKSKNEINPYVLTNENVYIFKVYNNKFDTLKGLPKSDYRIMSTLSDKHEFLGTYGQGYFIYSGKKWYPMPLDKKGHLKFAHAALCDDHGHVWISTNNGLFRTRLQDIDAYIAGKSKNIFYFYYDKSSGFLTNEFNGGCQSPAIKLRDGRFSFSSMDGLVQFDPLNVPSQFPQRPLHIIYVTLNGKTLDSIPSTLIIDQKIKDIKLEVSTPYYGHPANLVIQYKIPGYVDQWTDITDQRYITIQNATHGSFNIEIRKRNGFGNDDFDYISYPVTVLPYFYQTWWFMALLCAIGLSLTYIFSRWYNRYMIQKNMELEKIITKKNEGLFELNKELVEKIKQSDLFQSILVHDIKSPLRFIVSTSKLVLDLWPSVKEDIKKENISHIYESASKIKGFIEEALLWIQIRNGDHRAENNRFSVSTMLSENINFYNEDSKIISGAITLSMDCDQSLYIYTDKSLLSTIMRNLLANSIKYTDEGIITLYAYSKKDGEICVGCRDEGKGMSTTMIEMIMDNDYKGNSIRKDSFRMGYIIIKEITKLLGAPLTIQSEINKGTDVWVEFSNL